MICAHFVWLCVCVCFLDDLLLDGSICLIICLVYGLNRSLLIESLLLFLDGVLTQWAFR